MMITLKDTDSTLLHALVKDYRTQPEFALGLLNALTERLAKQFLLTAIVQLAELEENRESIEIQNPGIIEELLDDLLSYVTKYDHDKYHYQLRIDKAKTSLRRLYQVLDSKDQPMNLNDTAFSPSEPETINTILEIPYGSSPIKVEVYDNTFEGCVSLKPFPPENP